MVNNYTHIGFLPGNSLQSSELNELQERFYLNQTLDNNLMSNWLIFSDNYSFITGSTFDNYTGIPSTGIIPVNPNLVDSYTDSSSVIIRMNPGWYRVNNYNTNNISLWAYLDEQKITSLALNSLDATYTVRITISLEEILCSSLEDDEGYSFNSNTGGFVEPWIQGSNRFKLTITEMEVLQPIQQNVTDIVLCKIRKGVSNVSSSNFLVQYINNYKINDINIT